MDEIMLKQMQSQEIRIKNLERKQKELESMVRRIKKSNKS